MRFLVDRCAGRKLALWLRDAGHDVVNMSGHAADPGDSGLLARAHAERRVLITIDSYFGRLVFRDASAHAGLVRLPDVPAETRVALMRRILEDHAEDLERRAVLTVRDDRIRISETG